MTSPSSPLIIPGVDRSKFSLRENLFDGITNHHEGRIELYSGLYPPVIDFKPDNPMSLFSTGRASANMMVASKKPREILTGMYSFDVPTLNMQRTFSETCDAEVKPELDDELYPVNGLHVKMASVRSVSGFPQLPVSALPRDNSMERESLGLAAKLTPRQRQIAEAVWDQVWGHLKPSAMNIPRHSNSGAIRSVNDSEFKLQYCLGMFSNGRYNAMLKTFVKGDAAGLARDFEMAIVMGTNVRWQVDNPGKERKYWALDDCLREMSPQKRVITTKVVINGVEYPDFAAMRTRLINAGPWPVNSMLQPFASGVMYAMFDIYPETWHRDEDTIDEQMEGNLLWHGDVSSYDNTFSEEEIDLSLNKGKEYISEEIMELASSLYYSAYYTRPLGPDDKPTVMGDPMKIRDRHVKAGNRSGHAFTSLFAKVWKVIETLSVFDKMGYDVVRDLKMFLKGQMPLGVINNGDDEIAWFKTERDYRLFCELRSRENTPDAMFKVEREVGAVFSGRVFQKVGDRKYKSVERLTTPFQRILCPERSIGGNFRKFWPYGILDRHNKRDSHPTLALLWDIFDHSYRKELEPHHGTFLGLVQRAAAQLPFQVGSFNWKDIMVLDDASKMYHRFKPEEIKEEVIESAFRRLQPQFFASVFKDHYRGNLV